MRRLGRWLGAGDGERTIHVPAKKSRDDAKAPGCEELEEEIQGPRRNEEAVRNESREAGWIRTCRGIGGLMVQQKAGGVTSRSRDCRGRR
jgi:hypothetical protein